VKGIAALCLVVLAAPAIADDPPVIEHQPVPCTIPNKAIQLCATVTDDNEVAKSRIYFRASGEEFYSFVDMVFGGINYCGTVPAPREGAVRAIEYYIQAVDNAYQPQRTSTFQMNVTAEGACDFPPIEKDAAKASAITVYATNKKQGKKISDAFVAPGVNFVPVTQK
jgi:hypothetical protein